ncbi:MAG: hypothetical protein J7K00_02980 [Candidatus Diapherotrites archaeon]|nr:hypothetical protein [Candidatus Diapherotrites archaeon]
MDKDKKKTSILPEVTLIWETNAEQRSVDLVLLEFEEYTLEAVEKTTEPDMHAYLRTVNAVIKTIDGSKEWVISLKNVAYNEKRKWWKVTVEVTPSNEESFQLIGITTGTLKITLENEEQILLSAVDAGIRKFQRA